MPFRSRFSRRISFAIAACLVVLIGAAAMAVFKLHPVSASTGTGVASTRLGAASGPVVIDAARDPDAAAAAMVKFDSATDTSYTPVGSPAFTTTPAQILSDGWFSVPAGWPTSQQGTLTQTYTSSFAWSLGGSVSVSVEVKILDLANVSTSAEASYNHEWQKTHTSTSQVSVTVAPGYMAAIEGYTREVTFLGNYAFTAVDGTRYQVNNVKITEPGSQYGGDNTLTTFITVSRVNPPAATAGVKRPGLLPKSAGQPIPIPGAGQRVPDPTPTPSVG